MSTEQQVKKWMWDGLMPSKRVQLVHGAEKIHPWFTNDKKVNRTAMARDAEEAFSISGYGAEILDWADDVADRYENTEVVKDVIHTVHFAHRGYYLVCYDDIQLAATHHIPHQFYDYQYLDLLDAGSQNNFTFECIHTHFDRKVGYGEYVQLPLPELVAKQCYGEAYQGGDGE